MTLSCLSPRNFNYVPLRNITLSLRIFALAFASCFFVSCDRTPTDHPEYFDEIIRAAHTLKDPNDKAACIAYVDSVYRAFPSPGIGDLYRKYNFKRGWVLELEANYAEANVYCDSMLMLFPHQPKSPELIKMYSMAHMWKGEALIRMGKFKEAFASYHQGKLLLEQVPHACEVSSMYVGQIGTGYYLQGDFRKAMDYYQQSLTELAGCDMPEAFHYVWDTQGMLDNIGLCYDKLNIPDSAQYYFQAALDTLRAYAPQFTDDHSTLSIQRALGVIYGNRGDVYLKTGDSVQAEAMWKMSAEINLRKGSEIKDGQVTQAKLTDFYIASSRWQDAHTAIQQLRTSLDSFSNDAVALRYLHLLWLYYDKTAQVPQAYRALQQYHTMRDSIHLFSEPTSIDMEKEFEALANQHQQVLHKKEDALQSLYLVLTLGFSALILIILLLLWRNWKRVQADMIRQKENERASLSLKIDLEQSKRLLEATQALSKTGGWEYNLTSRQLFWTRQMCSLYEVADDFIPTLENNLAFYDAYNQGLISEKSAEAIQHQRPFSLDVELTTASQIHKWLRLLVIPVMHNGEVVAIRGAMMDITLQKTDELNLLRAKDALERSNRDMQRILKVVAHDLRSPINGITGLASLLLAEHGRSANDLKMLELIHVSSTHSSKLIAEILNLDFTDSFLIEGRERTELNTFLQQSVSLLQFSATEKNQLIKLVAEEGVYVTIACDKILRVVHNLIGNALKFSPSGSTILVSCVQHTDHVRLSVKDQGIGVPAEWGDSIFEMFTKSKRPGTSGEKSFGLGLSVSKKIVEAHGGRIGYERDPLQGTTFYVILPL